MTPSKKEAVSSDQGPWRRQFLCKCKDIIDLKIAHYEDESEHYYSVFYAISSKNCVATEDWGSLFLGENGRGNHTLMGVAKGSNVPKMLLKNACFWHAQTRWKRVH